MHLTFRHPFVGLALLFALAITVPAKANEIDVIEFWTVADVQGTVMARSGKNPWSETRPVTAGERIGPFSVVEAGPNAEAVLVRGGDRMTLYANTEIELPPTERSDGITRILQKAGEVLFRIKRRNQREFEVATPYLVAGVRGTTFGVTATDATSQLHVVEGAVAVRSADEDEAVERIVNALETASSGLGLAPVSKPANPAMVDAWDDRTIRQAEISDNAMIDGPATVREALSARALVATGAIDRIEDAPPSDIEDITQRFAERQMQAIDRATVDPSPRNRATATLAQTSSVRLAAAGLTLDPAAVPTQGQPATAIAVPDPAQVETPVTPAAPTPAAPVEALPNAAPAAVAPAPTAPRTTAPRQLIAPQGQAAAGQAPDQPADPEAEVLQPEGDGVVYTTFGVQTDDEVQEGTDAEGGTPILLPEPDLNIEGVGAGNQ